MNKREFYANLRELSYILTSYSTNLKDFAFHSTMYVDRLRQDISIIEKYCEKGSKILDLGCGAGQLALQLASLGFFVEAIDLKTDNPEMIEIFPKKRQITVRNLETHRKAKF